MFEKILFTIIKSKNQIGGNDKPPAGNVIVRIGNKRKLFKFIDPLIPEHNTYVEPFLGGGYIFFNKTKVADKNIINDLDTDVIKLMRMIKNANTNINDYNQSIINIHESKNPKIEEQQLKKISNYYFNNKYNSKEDKLLKQFIKLNDGFGGTIVKNKIYRDYGNLRQIKRLPLMKERLKNTILLNKNYKNVIKKYDSPKTFFYLDPPYENSGKLYEDDTIEYNELFNILNKIKGKFLLSLNDSKNIRNIFNKFKIKPIYRKTQGTKSAITTGGKELLISNY